MVTTRITPVPVKFELHAYGNVYDVSNSIDNWKELELILKRDGTSGIIHQVSFPFEFVLEAYDIVKDIFETYKYRAVADMYVYIRKDNWAYEDKHYGDPLILNLDFISYEKSDTKIEVDTKKTSLYDALKARRKIMYDIPVSGIKETKPWNFNRIELEGSIVYQIDSNVEIGFLSDEIQRTIGITHKEAETPVEDFIYTNTVADNADVDESTFFMEKPEGTSSTFLNVDVDIKGKLEVTVGIQEVHLSLTYFWEEADDTSKAIAYRRFINNGNNVIDIDFVTNVRDKKINAGDKLYLVVIYSGLQPPFLGKLTLDGTIGITYRAIRNPITIDLISPETLLRSLVNKITETEGVYQAEIEDFNEDSNNLIMIAAAESIRGIEGTETSEGAMVHTSFHNFLTWMNTFGYEQNIEGNVLIFKKREKSFRNDLVALELGENECAGLKELVNTEYLFTGVKIGYEKKEYENVNGRFEFNGEHNYSTDLTVIENVIELISPYRADSYGIEFLAWNRDKNSTDDKSDKDIFLVNVKERTASFETVENVLSGNILQPIFSDKGYTSPFNGNLNPLNLVALNAGLIGVSVERLTFTSSDSNAEVIINNQRLDSDYDIPEGKGLFEPVIYDIASRNIHNLPLGDDRNGIIRFAYQGEVYEGFIDEIAKNPAWETETTWMLFKKKN